MIPVERLILESIIADPKSATPRNAYDMATECLAFRWKDAKVELPTMQGFYEVVCKVIDDDPNEIAQDFGYYDIAQKEWFVNLHKITVLYWKERTPLPEE